MYRFDDGDSTTQSHGLTQIITVDCRKLSSAQGVLPAFEVRYFAIRTLSIL